MKKKKFIIILAVFIFFSFCSCSYKKLKNPDVADDVDLIGKVELTGELKNVVYKNVGGNQLVIDIYFPYKRTLEKSPVLIAFHGGGWTGGDRNQVIYMFDPLYTELREDGYTIISVQYRLAGKNSRFPAQIEDCVDAILYIYKNSEILGIDNNNIGVMGYSAGAHLAMLAAYAMQQFSVSGAVVDIKYCISAAGPTKFYDSGLDDYPPNIINKLSVLFGGSYDDIKDEYTFGSPYFYINEDRKTALLLLHGESDNVVPLSQSQLMYEACYKYDIFCRLIAIKNMAHDFEIIGYQDPVISSQAELFRSVRAFINEIP